MEEQDGRIVRRAVNSILSQFDFKTNELNQRHLREIKSVLKKNDSVVLGFCIQIFEELNKNDCDRRLGTVLLTDYFFQRSHKFRLELIKHLQDFLMLTLETDAVRCPLPGPISAAKNLKKWSIKIVKGWIEKFGEGYVKLKGAEKFLKDNKNFDFNSVGADLLIERRRAEEEQFKQRVQAKKCGDAISRVLSESKSDIERTINECRNSIDLLYPDIFQNGDEEKAGTSSELTKAEFEKLHGYKNNTELQIEITSAKVTIEETEDNSILVNALKDAAILLRKSLATLQKWLKRLIEVGGDQNQALIKNIVDLKGQIQRELNRCDRLKIIKPGSGSEDDESDGFVDVEDDEAALLGFEGPVMELKEEVGEFAGNEEQKPSTSSELHVEKEKSESEREIPKIPKLRYGLDLKYWGQKIEPAAVERNLYDGHRFWKGYDPGSDTAKESEQVYTEREILFIGKRPEIKKSCRFPMNNGKLCPRMDLQRCPFHGPIVERDEMGFPVHELGRK
uniref:UV-stimulated scaffold protein A n=1 Tax=Bursaphelenchus xylophilus TaxID=6326 RepID=A0A1I7SE15_BURXY